MEGDVRRGSGRPWVLVLLVAVASALAYLERQMLPVAKQSISLELGWDEIQYATVIVSGQAAGAIALLLGGGLVDRATIRWAPALIIGVSSLAAMVTGAASSVGQHVAGRVTMSGVQVLAVPAFFKTIRIILPSSQLTLGIGIASAAGAVGAIVAPLLVPQLTAQLGWRAAFMVVGAFGILLAVAWAMLAPSAAAGAGAGSAPRASAPTLRLYTSPVIWGLAGAKLFSDATWWLLLFWLPDLFVRDFGLGEAQIGMPLALIYSLGALGSLAAGLASVQMAKRGLALHQMRLGTMLLCAVGVTMLPFALLAREPMTAALVIGLAVAAHQCFAVNLFAIIAEVAPPDMVGRYTALCVFVGRIGGMVVTMAAALMLSAHWGYAPMLVAAPLCYLVALALLRWLVPSRAASGPEGDVDAPALAT